MNYLNEGIKKLRAVYVIKAKDEATKTVRLWRGMRNLDVGDKFLANNTGGTEVAPMSTTTDMQVRTRRSSRRGCYELRATSNTLQPATYNPQAVSAAQVAVHYGLSQGTLLFLLKVDNFLQYGAELQWLSAFPGESEGLYPPLTYLQPTGRVQVVTVGASRFKVVEVTPNIP